MKFTYYPTYNYVSITSPKAASTLMDRIHDSISKPKSLVDYKLLSTLKKIMVCRNPYARCLSAYYNKFITLKQSYPNDPKLFLSPFLKKNKKWKNFYAAFYIETTTGKAPMFSDCCPKTEMLVVDYINKINDSFEAYLLFLNNSIKENRWFVNNQHFLPQLCSPINIDVFDDNLFLIKLENNFNEMVLDSLQKVLPSNIYEEYLPKINILLGTTPNKTSNSISLNGTEYTKYTSTQMKELLNKIHGLPCVENMLNNITIKLINEIYHKDFIGLGYEQLMI